VSDRRRVLYTLQALASTQLALLVDDDDHYNPDLDTPRTITMSGRGGFSRGGGGGGRGGFGGRGAFTGDTRSWMDGWDEGMGWRWSHVEGPEGLP
jgi:hypothetical protein